ncbi:MAG: hypothetical protein E6471_06080, partial [Bradyrhizobium sp.]|nr:hypothetical protein [Bradyrhizobium sp.]
VLFGSIRGLVVLFLVLHLQRLCLRGHSLLPKRARSACGIFALGIAAPACSTQTVFDAERAAHI